MLEGTLLWFLAHMLYFWKGYFKSGAQWFLLLGGEGVGVRPVAVVVIERASKETKAIQSQNWHFAFSSSSYVRNLLKKIKIEGKKAKTERKKSYFARFLCRVPTSETKDLGSELAEKGPGTPRPPLCQSNSSSATPAPLQSVKLRNLSASQGAFCFMHKAVFN